MVLGIDIGGTKIMVGVLDKNGQILYCHKEKSYAVSGSDVLLEQIFAIIDTYYSKYFEEVSSIGITLPGIVDKSNGILKYAPFSSLKNVPVKQIFTDKYNKTVYIDNDVNACAWGEKWFGVARDCDNFVWMTVSTGIGGGIVMDGKLLNGYDGMAGEFGHIVVGNNDELCSCGQRGCLEAVAAGPAWVNKALKEMYLGVKSILKNKEDELTAKDIADAARHGDKLAQEIVQGAARYIGIAISWIINILNPQMVVLGGGVMEADDLMLPIIREEAYQRAISAKFRKTPIVKTSLGYNAGLIGAASLALYPED
ncbi:MAG: ROK family protein [Clostridiales bacterium]|nr:ROK family protein [Clostridiales bacterium]